MVGWGWRLVHAVPRECDAEHCSLRAGGHGSSPRLGLLRPQRVRAVLLCCCRFAGAWWPTDAFGLHPEHRAGRPKVGTEFALPLLLLLLLRLLPLLLDLAQRV